MSVYTWQKHYSRIQAFDKLVSKHSGMDRSNVCVISPSQSRRLVHDESCYMTNTMNYATESSMIGYTISTILSVWRDQLGFIYTINLNGNGQKFQISPAYWSLVRAEVLMW